MMKTVNKDFMNQEFAVTESGIVIVKKRIIAVKENILMNTANNVELIIPSKRIIRSSLTLQHLEGGNNYGK